MKSLLFLSLLSSLVASQDCQQDPKDPLAQNCIIAKLSGSMPTPYSFTKDKRPKGGNKKGDDCVEKSYMALGLPLPEGYVLGQGLGRGTKIKKRFRHLNLDRRATNKDIPECKPNMFFYARGTVESKDFGAWIGKELITQVRNINPGQWNFYDMDYEATMSGNDCLGMDGAVKCIPQLGQLVSKCPNSKIAVGGYSQGAMVMHGCLAFSPQKVKDAVKAVVFFGDPFQSAVIKGFPMDRVKTWCAKPDASSKGDGVCAGRLEISSAHLSYWKDSSQAKQAADFIKSKMG